MRAVKYKSILRTFLLALVIAAAVLFLRTSLFEVQATVADADRRARNAVDIWSETQTHLLAENSVSADRSWERAETAILELTNLRILEGLGMLEPSVENARRELPELSRTLSRWFIDPPYYSETFPNDQAHDLTRNLQLISRTIADYSDDQSLYFQNLLLFAALLLLTGIFILVVLEQRNRTLFKAEQQARNLSRYLISDYEKRMHGIALDLHDDIAQDLYLVRMETQVSRRESLLDQTIEKIRRLSYDIRPGKAASLPMAQGIRSLLTDTAEGTEWTIRFRETGLTSLRLPYEVRIHLYRIVQEALTNIRKHAAARSVSIVMVAAYPALKITITDDGEGFDPGSVQERGSEGMGLRGIRERIEIIGGRLDIQSSRQNGTRVQIELNTKEFTYATD
jgi:signal transduction histidine kinase